MRHHSHQTSPFHAKALCIDLDGTLIDTASEITAGLNAALEELGHAPLEYKTAKNAIGLGSLHLIKEALGFEAGEDAFAKIHERFCVHYPKYLMTSSRVYEGVVQVLMYCQAQHISCGVVTNKSRAFTLPLLEGHDLMSFFEVVVCGDDFADRKPDTTGTLYAMTQMGDFTPQEVVFVGDSRTDLQTALNASMPFVGVSYGYNGDTPLRVDPPHVLIDDFGALQNHILPFEDRL